MSLADARCQQQRGVTAPGAPGEVGGRPGPDRGGHACGGWHLLPVARSHAPHAGFDLGVRSGARVWGGHRVKTAPSKPPDALPVAEATAPTKREAVLPNRTGAVTYDYAERVDIGSKYASYVNTVDILPPRPLQAADLRRAAEEGIEKDRPFRSSLIGA